MPLKERNILQAALAAASGEDLKSWIERYAARFNELVTDEEFVQLVRRDPAAAQKRLEI